MANQIVTLSTIHNLTFDLEETIISVALAGPDKLVMLLSSGMVTTYNIKDQSSEVLFSVLSEISYADGGFDLTDKVTIYTLDEIVVVVNDYKRHGFVHYPGKYHALHLWRQDYHADISCYPVALFKDSTGVPHLIYGEAWNHVQIMNLDTLQVLTAAKSLIEEGAEEMYLDLHKKYSQNNTLPWPRPFDYFYGKLLLSPNQKKFLSAGWVWGSCDAYYIFEIDHFINSHRIAAIPLLGWEHNNRAVCWISDDHFALAYNPFKEGDDGTSPDSPAEIHIYRIEGNKAEIERKITPEGPDLVDSRFYVHQETNSLIALSARTGTTVLSADGQILFRDENFKPDDYDPETGLFLKTEGKKISVYGIR